MYISHNVMLRIPKIQDSSSYFRWINNREIVEYNANFIPISIESHNQWFDNLNIDPSSRYFSIVINKEQLIGSCSLRKINFKEKSAQLQVRIGEKKYLNKGYGTIALSLLLKFGFSELKLDRIILNVLETNIRAIKAYEKCCFKKIRLLKNEVYMNGSYKNMYEMVVEKVEYLRNNL